MEPKIVEEGWTRLTQSTNELQNFINQLENEAYADLNPNLRSDKTNEIETEIGSSVELALQPIVDKYKNQTWSEEAQEEFDNEMINALEKTIENERQGGIHYSDEFQQDALALLDNFFFESLHMVVFPEGG